MIQFKKVTPSEIDEATYDRIADLNHKEFDIEYSLMKKLLIDKDEIHLYYAGDELVGVIGFKSFTMNNNYIIYLGSAVIDERYCKCGLLTKSLLHVIFRAYLFHPFKNKYCCGFATTPQAYSYYTLLDEYWPRAHSQPPESILDVQTKFMHVLGRNKFEIKNGVIIDNQLSGGITYKNKKIIPQETLEYFNSINPTAEKGTQILCIVPFTFTNYWKVFSRYLSKLKKKLSKMISISV